MSCWSAGREGIAATALRGTTSEFSVIHASLAADAWATSSFDVDAQVMSCPVFGADGAIYVALGGRGGPDGLELVRLANGTATSRVLSDAAQAPRAEVHRDGDDLVVGYCQGSDMFPCDRNLVRVDPDQFFADADFSFEYPCPAVDDGAAVCAYDFAVPHFGYLSSVGGELWQFELHETLGSWTGGEWDIPFGRWAASPLGAPPVPLPTGFGVDLFERGDEVVARVPRALRLQYARSEYLWFSWEGADRTWQQIELSPDEFQEIERNFAPIPGHHSNWMGSN